MVQPWSTAREFHRGRHCVLLRSHLEDGRPVILKTVRHEPGTDDIDAAVLRHEFDILQGLDVPGVVHALALDVTDGAPVLVLEDALPPVPVAPFSPEPPQAAKLARSPVRARAASHLVVRRA